MDSDNGAVLPLARMRTIMRSNPEVLSVSQEAVFAMSKATELFIEHLCQSVIETVPPKATLSYAHLANHIQDTDEMDFLQEIVPRKVKVSELNLKQLS